VTALVLVAHGSSDRESNAIVHRLARRCRAALPSTTVVPTFLDHVAPRPSQALRQLARIGEHDVVVVPLLFTAAYHVQVDLPAEIAAATDDHPALVVRVTPALVDPASARADEAPLLDALDERLAAALAADAEPADALVLASAGTSDAGAREAVAAFAQRWAGRHRLPVIAAHASAAAPDPGAAVRALQSRGARRVAVGSLFLGPGRLPSRARARALEAGAVAVAEHLGDCAAVTTVVLARFDQAVERVGRPA
jgi:sirohydrochlorin ferrochelatase